MRSDEKFNLFWKDVENKAAIFDVDPPRLPRKKRVPARIEECLIESAAPKFDDDMYLITEKYTTSPWIASSMLSKIDSIRKISKHTSNQKISFSKLQKEATSIGNTMMLWHYMTVILTEFRFMCSWKRYQSTVKKLLTLHLFVP